MTLYGTPMTVALNQRLEEDKIATTSPGFGIAAAADGTRYPYLFPIAATYWSQGAAAVQFVKDKLGGNLKGKKIAYVFYDNPAGKEPLPIVEELQKKEGFELRTFAVPPPGVEVGAQVLDITQRYRPDFVIAHLFGRSPAAAIKAFKSNGYPLSKVVGLVWASSEADIDAAGGFGVAEGYHAMQFAGAGDDYPVRQQIKAMYKKDGKEPIELMDKNTVYYNRGLLQAAIHVEAIRNALKATGGKQPTGTDIKKGLEQIRDFTLGGLVPPLGDHADRPRRRRLGAGLPGQRRQIRQGDRLVPRLSRCRRARTEDRGVAPRSSCPRKRAPRDERRGGGPGPRFRGRDGWSDTPMLALNNIEVVYDGVILVLKGVSLFAEEGRITTLLGANGAGKTTTLKAISGLLHSERGQVTKGTVELDGERLDRLPAPRRRQARRHPGLRGKAGFRKSDRRGEPGRRRAYAQ